MVIRDLFLKIKNLFKDEKEKQGIPSGGFTSLAEYNNFKRTYYPYIAVLVLFVGIGITVYQVQKQQEYRGKAAFEGLTYKVPTQLFTGTLPSELGVEGNGNVYAPEVIFENGVYKMWYGGQNRNSGADALKDRIHYAESTNGINWTKLGPVATLPLSNPSTINGGNPSNHINDPTVVKVNDTYYMYYTDAWTAENDRISMATSPNGQNWTKVKMIIDGGANIWSNKKVGRPSAMFEGGMFHMWYDALSTSPSWPGRYIAHAWSNDGSNWATDPNPVHDNGVGGPLIGGAVDVKKYNGTYFIVMERREGTQMAYSSDGINWTNVCDHPSCIWIPKSGGLFDQFGHITPFLFIPTDITVPSVVYFGGARNTFWSSNVIGATKIAQADLQKYTIGPTPTPDIECTQDIFTCPDGTRVGRVPPACNFAPCPIVPTATPIPTPIPTSTPIPPTPTRTPTPQPTNTPIPPTAIPTQVVKKPGDVNGDGFINSLDLNEIVINFNRTGIGMPADLNNDGIVNALDFNEVVANYGR